MSTDEHAHTRLMVRAGDALCVHGGAAQAMPGLLPDDAPADAEPPIVLALAAHPIRSTVLNGDRSHDATDITEHVFMLDVEDTALLVAWLLAAVTRGGLMRVFKGAMVDAHTQVARDTAEIFTTAPPGDEQSFVDTAINHIQPNETELGGYL